MSREPVNRARLISQTLALAAVVATLLFVPSPARAQECGCAVNGLTPVFGTNYGTSLDGSQTWLVIEGDPLMIAVGSKGGIAVWVCQPNGIRHQYFSEDSWGTNVWLNGTDSSHHYHSNYYSGGTAFTQASHAKNGDWEIVTELGLGSDAVLRQVVTYSNGDYYFRRHWELTNTSGGTLSDLRLFHGGDTYFGGSDSARSWWNATQNMIYVNNTSFTNCGVMGFYGSPATPADHHYGGNYYTGYTQASASARLDDTADSNYVDAGYQLEWDHATLANGDTWVIEAYELWTDPTPVQVLPPADQLTVADATVTVEFTLHNLDTSSRTFDLTAVSDLGWTATLTGGSPVTVAGLAQQAVPVEVTVPAGVSEGVSSSITLTAEDSGGGGTGSASMNMEVFEPDYTIEPLSVDFGSVALGESSTQVVTITNSGSDITMGTVGSPNGLASPFDIAADYCSGRTLASGDTCTIRVSFTPSSAGAAGDNFNIPVLDPVVASHVISVTGEGIDPEPEIVVEGNSVEIVDGDTTPSTDDDTDFGTVDISGSPVVKTYTIWNTGAGTLSIGTISIYGGNPTDFGIDSLPSSTVPPGTFTTLSIEFDPWALGTRSTTLSVSSNDSDESPYTFTIQGNAMSPLGVSSHTPAVNDIDAAVDSDIVVQFSQTVDGATVTESTFNVDGSLSGEIDGVYSGGGTNTITFDPTTDFKAGETVMVTLTTGVQGEVGGGTLPAAVSWQFTVDAPQGYAAFTGGWESPLTAVSRRAVLGDLDGDGDLDAFMARSGGSTNGVYLNDGSGEFVDSGQSLGAYNCQDAALGDLDGDGDLDAIVVVYNAGNMVWLNDGSGVFIDSGQSLGSLSSARVALGDLDGDGDLDAFVAEYSGQGNTVWLNAGTGAFIDSGQSLGGSHSGGCALGDVDGDGDLDAFVSNWASPNKVWLNVGGGVFTDSGQALGGTAKSMAVALGDLDGDGDLDAFVGNLEGPNEVWLNSGGTFVDSGQSLGGATWSRGVSLGDLDADGDLDALVANDVDAPNTVWVNDGFGAFSAGWQSLGSASSSTADLADLDGDGDLDVFVANKVDPDRVWLNVEPVEMDVRGNNTSIADGDTSPSAGDHTDFGTAELVTGSVVRTFTIKNTGTATLALTEGSPYVAVAGAHASDFSVTAIPSNSIAGGDSTTFDITFDPSDVGTRTATLSIANDDADENPYDFSVQGFCVAAPVITSPDSAGATEDVYFSYRATATDVDGPGVDYSFDEMPAWLTADADSVYGTPLEGDGNTSFRIVATDGSLSDTLVVAVTVTEVNDPPVITSPGTAGATEDVYFSYRATATDVDGPGLSFSFDQLPAWLAAAADSVYGTPLEGDGDTSFRVVATDGSLSDTLVVAVTVTAVNDAPVITSPDTADAKEDVYFSYAADATDSDSPGVTFSFDQMPAWMSAGARGVYGKPLEGDGDTSFRIVATDGVLSDTLVVAVTVTAVNDPPVITSADTATAMEDVPFSYRATAADPDGPSLTFSFDDMPAWFHADADSVYGTPPEGAVDASFLVTVTDGSLSDVMVVTATVTRVNDPPVITSPATAEAAEDVHFNYVAAATDPDGDGVTFRFDQLPAWLKTGDDSVYGTPREGDGDTSFRIVASDGRLSDTLMVAVAVKPVNDPPVITSASTAGATEDLYFSYQATATDADGPGLSFSFEHLPAWLSAAGGTVSGTPGEGVTSTSFRVVATDGILSDTLLVTITVMAVNDEPEITSEGAVTATEHQYFCYHASATDPDVRGITFSFDMLPAWLAAGADSAFGTPPEGAENASFRVVATDGSLCDTLAVAVTVVPVNDPPVITSPVAASAIEDVYFTYLAVATDPDGPSLAISFDQVPSWLSVDANSVCGTPLEGDANTSFRVIASDGSLCDTLMVSLSVSAENDAPTITSAQSVEATEGERFRYVASASDVDGPSLSFSFAGLPEWLSACADSVCGTPGYDATDTSFMVVASDGSLSDTLRVSVVVTKVTLVAALRANHPNPFRNDTVLQYDLPAAADVLLTIYDVSGREVVRLVDAPKQAGSHEVTWDACNSQGRRVAAGIYFARINTPEFRKSIKMMLVR